MPPLPFPSPPPFVDWIVGLALLAAPLSGSVAPELVSTAAPVEEARAERLTVVDGDEYSVVPPAPADEPPAAPRAAGPERTRYEPPPWSAARAATPEQTSAGIECALELAHGAVTCACRAVGEAPAAEIRRPSGASSAAGEVSASRPARARQRTRHHGWRWCPEP